MAVHAYNPTLARQRQKDLGSLESSRSVSLNYLRFSKRKEKIEAKDNDSVVKAPTAFADWVGHNLL